MDADAFKLAKFHEALERLLDTDVAGMFAFIHRVNELIEEGKIQNPLPPQTFLDLGITVGSIQLMQECVPKEDPPGDLVVHPRLLAAIYKGYLRAVFYLRLPHGETIGDVLFREDYKLHDAILAVVRDQV